ncbi:hypothetical protein ACS0TY_028816 [Phlomoides rotata]
MELDFLQTLLNLPKLVKLTTKVTEQVRLLAIDEDEELAETSAYDIIPPYDQARALGKTNIDVDRIAAGLPCGSEGFLLMFARWRKLLNGICIMNAKGFHFGTR